MVAFRREIGKEHERGFLGFWNFLLFDMAAYYKSVIFDISLSYFVFCMHDALFVCFHNRTKVF